MVLSVNGNMFEQEFENTFRLQNISEVKITNKNIMLFSFVKK